MRVLVTGGSGHIGHSVCKALQSRGFNVRVLLHRSKLKGMNSGLEMEWGDIAHAEAVRRATEDVDAVVHLAGLVQPLTEQEPDLARRVNLGGTQTLVEVIKEKDERIPFVFTSSAVVFGPCPDAAECLHPDRNACNPTSVYAETKVQAEEVVRESGIDYVILRLTSIPYPSIGLSDIRTHMFSIPLKNRLEFCHPDDAALAIVNAVTNFAAVEGKTLMIGGGPGQQILYEDMLRRLFMTFGLPLPPEHRFTREPFPLHWYDTAESQRLLTYQRKTLDDYSVDLARQVPAPLVAIMRHFIGPAFGNLIVRLL